MEYLPGGTSRKLETVTDEFAGTTVSPEDGKSKFAPEVSLVTKTIRPTFIGTDEELRIVIDAFILPADGVILLFDKSKEVMLTSGDIRRTPFVLIPEEALSG